MKSAPIVRFLFVVYNLHGILLLKNIHNISLLFFYRTHANDSSHCLFGLTYWRRLLCRVDARHIHINLHYKMVCHSVLSKCSRTVSRFCICVKNLAQSLLNSRSYSSAYFLLVLLVYVFIQPLCYILLQSTNKFTPLSPFCLKFYSWIYKLARRCDQYVFFAHCI